MEKQCLKIDERDNLGVALIDLTKGTMVQLGKERVEIKTDISAKHKFALRDLEKGEVLSMYGVPVGKAISAIAAGEVISRANTVHEAAVYDSSNTKKIHWTAPSIEKLGNRHFLGYHRKDGSVGTENNWLVIPLVFCENRNITLIEEALADALGYTTKKNYHINTEVLIKKYQAGASTQDLANTPIISSQEEYQQNRIFPNVDGIRFLRHDGGCGGTKEDAQALCDLLAGYITNANVAGATVLSLGCQHAQIDMLKEALDARIKSLQKPVYFLEQQRAINEKSFLEEAVQKTFIGLVEANKIGREKAPLNKLVLGLECGGSDGFSGISANPALGHTSDLVVAIGGSAVLSEFPELNGVEQELLNRCTTDQLAHKFAELMDDYASVAKSRGTGFENNPSPGNVKDGLITDAMKSAGAAKKGGTSPIVGVLDYVEKVNGPGLHLLCTPGNDVESTTGLAGAGCNLIVFTTGLGTPTGNPICPVVKISSNTNLFNKMQEIIDIDAGTIISGEETIEEVGERLLELLIKIASGKTVCKARRNDQNDFIPWKRGISL
ncbi:UxaA family hydrolase [Eudoraea chungangensis]|uniref:UxaA family hydrolase n=1 Tax=Eudoraea chungangensis TaxID=1481905 RepID=UPI0023EB6BD8|nr:altronate dehydratase family protein [Eudoraea chungangensis]